MACRNDVTVGLYADALIDLLYLSNEYLVEELQQQCEHTIGLTLSKYSEFDLVYLSDVLNLRILKEYLQLSTLNSIHVSLQPTDVTDLVSYIRDMNFHQWLCFEDKTRKVLGSSMIRCGLFLRSYLSIYLSHVETLYSCSYLDLALRSIMESVPQADYDIHCELGKEVICDGCLPSLLFDISCIDSIGVQYEKNGNVEEVWEMNNGDQSDPHLVVRRILSNIHLRIFSGWQTKVKNEKDRQLLERLEVLRPDQSRLLMFRAGLLMKANPGLFRCNGRFQGVKVEDFVPGTDFDVILSTSDNDYSTPIRAHRAVLAAASGKLAGMIRFHSSQSPTTFGVLSLRLNSISAAYLPCLLWYMYCGYLPCLSDFAEDETDILVSLLFVSNEYIMDRLTHECKRLLMLRLSPSIAPSLFVATNGCVEFEELPLACAIITLLNISPNSRYRGAHGRNRSEGNRFVSCQENMFATESREQRAPINMDADIASEAESDEKIVPVNEFCISLLQYISFDTHYS